MGNCRRAAAAALLLVWILSPYTAAAAGPGASVETLIRKLPPRKPCAPTGSEFIRTIAGLDTRQREKAILDQLLQGNLPPFLRQLKAVPMQGRDAGGKVHTATIFVMPDYLAVGSNADFVRVPVNHYTASAAAARMGFVLPTRKMVDAVWRQSAHHLRPEPMKPGPKMCSTGYFLDHNESIERQCASVGVMKGQLIAGHKKDVVLTNRLSCNPERVAIYGWHRPGGLPIQPLSTVHGARYADYSHGVRLVSDRVWIDGAFRSTRAILEDPKLSVVLSDEGRITDAAAILSRPPLNAVAGR